MTLLGVMAEPAILALVGEKWLPSVPFLQLLCLSGATYHLTTVNLNMLLVLGRSDLSLRLEVIKKIIIGISIVVGLQYGIFGLVIGEVISTYINLMINTYYSKKFLNYSVVEQFRDILPTILISLATGAAVYFVSSFPGGAPVVHLILGSICGGLLYLGLHLAARTQEMEIIRRMVIPKTIQLIAKLR